MSSLCCFVVPVDESLNHCLLIFISFVNSAILLNLRLKVVEFPAAT